MKKIFVLLCAVLCTALLASTVVPPLKNGSKNRLEMTQQDGVITMYLKNTDGYDSEAGAKIKGFEKDKNYEFSCDVNAEARNIVYVQVKLFKQGKLLARPSSTANRKNSQRIKLIVNTLDADTAILNVRINNRTAFIDKKVEVSNMYFGAPTADAATEFPRFEIVPGFNAASIYIGKNSALRAADCSAQVKYKKAGSGKWIKGIDLVYDESRKQFRGSLLGLEENASYEYVIDINDNGKKDTIKGKFVTRSSELPVKKIVVLTQENAAKLLADAENGTEKGYIRYTAKPGTVLKMGIAKDVAVDLTDKRFIIFENITITGGLRYTFNVECANDIVFRNCDISGFGRVGKHDPHKDGKYFIKKRAINYDAGINIQASERITVEKCFIHDPLNTANSWFYSHPAGPTAVYIGDSAQVVLRYNDFIGSDKHRWNDAIEGWGNGSLNGSVKADAEIYGNYLAFGNDDGMEMDGGQMNCRFAYNKSEGLLCGFSTAPCLIGPAYHFRNLVHRGGDEFDFIGVGVKNNYATGGRGALFFFNNTVLDHRNGFSSPSFNDKEKRMHKEKYLKVFSRNNLVRTEGPLYGSGVFRPAYYNSDVDFDFFDGNGEYVETLRQKDVAANTVVSKAKFHNEKYGDYTPAHDSKALNTGVFIPGVTEEKNITAGAFQKRGDQLPLRYAPFYLDRTVVALKMLSNEAEQAVVTLTPAKGCNGEFKIIQPRGADFFTVTPAQGKFNGKSIQFIVKSVPGKIKAARRNTSAFAIKMADGWSRPVSVEVDSRANAKLLAKARKNTIMGSVTNNGKTQVLTVDVPKDGFYWLFVKASGVREYFKAKINNEKETKRMIHAPGYSKNPWCALSNTIYQGSPNRPVKLKAGKTTVTIRAANARTPVITAFAITKNPDDFRLAPDDL